MGWFLLVQKTEIRLQLLVSLSLLNSSSHTDRKGQNVFSELGVDYLRNREKLSLPGKNILLISNIN